MQPGTNYVIQGIIMQRGDELTPVEEISKLWPFEPRCEKTGLRGFRPGTTQTGLYNHTRWLEARNFVIRK